nr:hypothetical protein [uncultured Bacteroides sp.]
MDEYDGGFDFPGILKDFQTMNKVFGDMVEKKFRAKSACNKYLTVYKHGELSVPTRSASTSSKWKRQTGATSRKKNCKP